MRSVVRVHLSPFPYGNPARQSLRNDAGWSSLEARRAHNPKVAGSNPAPATFLFRCEKPISRNFVSRDECLLVYTSKLVRFDAYSLTKASFRRAPASRVPAFLAHNSLFAQIAQLVEQRTENPRVTGSIPVLGTPVKWLQPAWLRLFLCPELSWPRRGPDAGAMLAALRL